MTEFFMPMIPPTTTAQMHRIDKCGRIYDSPELADARQKLTAYLSKHVPEQPYTCGVRLTVKWLFPKGRHKSGEYKTTRPDTDNLQKLLKDCMTKCRYWKDDALVCSEIVEKFHASTTGIYIRIEAVE